MNGSGAPRRVQVQQRDLDILSGLLDLRVMTLSQVAEIHFSGSHAAAKRRVHVLKREGILGELPKRRFERSVLMLTRKAIGLLRRNDRLSNFASQSDRQILRRSVVSRRLLAHELLISETKAVLYRTVREGGHFQVESFSAWPGRTRRGARIRQRGTLVSRQIDIRPDAVADIRFAGQPCVEVFVEVDRSTESWPVILRKLDNYNSVLRPSVSGQLPSQVLLMVFLSRRRADRLACLIARRHTFLDRVRTVLAVVVV